MHLKSLSIVNFKNLAQANMELSTGINAFIGSNGAGKSNVLDAIHYLALTKSMVQMTDGQSVRHGEDFFMVDGSFQGDSGKEEKIVCSFSKQRGGGKKLKRGGKEYDRLADHIGLVPLVIVSPQESLLITDSGDERRRFMNSFISQIDGRYLNTLIRYNSTLQQRNKFLKSSPQESMLDVYDAQLVSYGEALHCRRMEIIAALQPIVQRLYGELSQQREEVTLEYRSQLNGESYADLLLAARQKDMICEHTSVGVHRDDLILKIGGHPLRKYGSQGQQKSALIALKMAQFEILTNEREERPILLLDDIFDKLDEERVALLVWIVSRPEYGQIFITDCHNDMLANILHSMEDCKIFGVQEGEITAR